MIRTIRIAMTTERRIQPEKFFGEMHKVEEEVLLTEGTLEEVQRAYALLSTRADEELRLWRRALDGESNGEEESDPRLQALDTIAGTTKSMPVDVVAAFDEATRRPTVSPTVEQQVAQANSAERRTTADIIDKANNTATTSTEPPATVTQDTNVHDRILGLLDREELSEGAHKRLEDMVGVHACIEIRDEAHLKALVCTLPQTMAHQWLRTEELLL